MKQEEHDFIQDLIKLLKKYNKCGFVGTVCNSDLFPNLQARYAGI